MENNDYSYLELRNGLRIKIRTNSTDLQAFVNVWIIKEYEEQDFNIMENDTIIDVGGHIGLFALYTSQFCTKGKIYSFEPVNKNYELMQSNVKDNNITNVFLFNLAVSDKMGKTKIFLDHDESGHSIKKESAKFEEVQTLSLTDIMNENRIDRCNFLKLDCEGAEFEVLKQTPDKVFEKIDKIVLEYHLFDHDVEPLKKLRIKLEKNGFEYIEYPYSTELGLLFAKKWKNLLD